MTAERVWKVGARQDAGRSRRPAWSIRSLSLAAALAALALALLALAAAGCDMPSTGGLGQVKGSGVTVTTSYDFAGFTKLAVENGFNVTVRQGEEYTVSVTVDDNLVEEHLEVELDGDTLRIGLAELWNYVGVTATATVTLPALEGIEASGASAVETSGFASGDPLQLSASGASALTLAGVSAGAVDVELSGSSRLDGELEAGEFDGDVSGASGLELRGSAETLRLDASGGSRLDLAGLTARDGQFSLSGGSNASVSVTGTLDVDASGGSRLDYSGSPQLGSIDTSGGSVVEPAGD